MDKSSPTFRLLTELLVHNPIDSGLHRVRGGSQGDGGYVILDHDLGKIESFYSYGVSDNYTFDAWLHEKTGALGRLFDPTVSYPSIIQKGLHFRKIGLSNSQGSISDHIRSFADQGKRMLLKNDVEGSEWPWLAETTDAELFQFDQILLELHGLQDQRRHSEFADALAKVNRHFNLFHVHANNFECPSRFAEGLLPSLLECSDIRKDLVACIPNNSVHFPISGIDAPNAPDIPELRLNFWPFISGQPEDLEKRSLQIADLYLEAHHTITRQRRMIKALNFQLKTLQESGSWRLTRPLRFLTRLLSSASGKRFS